MILDTPLLTINSPGGFASVQVLGTGTLTANSTGNTVLLIDSAGRDLGGTVSSLSVMGLRASSINMTGPTSAGDVLTLISIDDPLLNTDVSRYVSPYLVLSAPSIGTNAGSPFELNAAVQEVDIVNTPSITVGNAFIRSNAVKQVTIGAVDINGDLNFRANASIEVGINGAVPFESSAGKIDIATTAGTLEVADGVSVLAETGISLVNTGIGKKDKLILGTNSTVQTTNVNGNFGRYHHRTRRPGRCNPRFAEHRGD